MKKYIKQLLYNLVRQKVELQINSQQLISKFLNNDQLTDFHNRHVEVQNNSIISSDSKIGDYTYVGYNTCISKSDIGKYCSIANNVSIGNGEHDINEISTSSLFYTNPYEKLTLKQCIIGNDVWIGVDAIIRRGVKIGNGAVIGANSFVNMDIPDFAIAVGNPARILRYRFSEKKISMINSSEWWNYKLAEAKIKIKELEHLNLD